MNRNWLTLRTFITIVVQCGVAVSITDVGWTQQTTQQKPAPLVGMIGLIVREPVLKELGIENESQELVEIRQLLKPFSAVLHQRLHHPTDDDRTSGLTSQELYAKIEAEFVLELKQRLKPEQFARLQQIHWQRWGMRAIEDPELAKLLELTPDQNEKIAATRLTIEARRRDLTIQRQDLRRQGVDDAETKRKLEQLDAEQLHSYNEILSSEQNEKLIELKGAPFELGHPAIPDSGNSAMSIQTRPGGLMALALMDPVSKELGLNPISPEISELRKLSKAHSLELRQQMQSRGATRERRERAREIEADLQKKYDIELKQLLTPQQYQRLRQIHWQRLGREALNEPDVAQGLEITAGQQAELADVNLETFKKIRGLLNPTGGSHPVGAAVNEVLRRKIQEIVTETEDRSFNVLSASQRKKWEDMKGEAFDVDQLKSKIVSAPSQKPDE